MTDFGHRDPYVGVLKGVILARAPAATLVDICHEVPAQNVQTASFFLRASTPYFPDETLFVAVVDPGVGTSRAVLWGRNKRGQQFLAPDNGLLDGAGIVTARRVTNRRLFLAEVGATFHGRDVFAPTAAALAGGLDPARLGPAAKPPRRSRGKAAKAVLHVDRFGNAITTLGVSSVGRGKSIWVNDVNVGPLKKTYADVRSGAPLALVGSYGLVECSVRGGDFASTFKVRPGDPVYVR